MTKVQIQKSERNVCRLQQTEGVVQFRQVAVGEQAIYSSDDSGHRTVGEAGVPQIVSGANLFDEDVIRETVSLSTNRHPDLGLQRDKA